MCRLFPPELIETIATGMTPAPEAIERIAAHIRRDWTAAGGTGAFAQDALSGVCRKLAEVALACSFDWHVAEPAMLAARPRALQFME